MCTLWHDFESPSELACRNDCQRPCSGCSLGQFLRQSEAEANETESLDQLVELVDSVYKSLGLPILPSSSGVGPRPSLLGEAQWSRRASEAQPHGLSTRLCALVSSRSTDELSFVSGSPVLDGSCLTGTAQ